MRKIILFILLYVLVSHNASAQTYNIDTSELSFENKLRPCFSVQYDADARTVKKAWSKFLKKNYKIKTKGVSIFSDKDVVNADDVTIHSISDKRMNIYIRATDISSGSDVKYFMSFGYDFFIGPGNYPDAFKGMKDLFNDFSVGFLNDYYSDEVSGIIKKIKKLEKDKRSKQRSISKNKTKARKESNAVASGLESKNISLGMEIDQVDKKIGEYKKNIDEIKIKQSGITRS